MKLMKYPTLVAIVALGLCAAVRAEEKSTYPNISFVGPGSGKTTVTRDQFVLLVVEGPFISYEGKPVSSAGVVDFVNSLLKIKNVSYLGIHSREGVKYGDVIRAIDVLRKTNAKDIGVSMIELPAGREP
jgi:hypothetical protein